MRRSLARLLVAGSILAIGVAAQAQTPSIIWGTITDPDPVKPSNITWGNGGSSQRIDTISNIIWGNGGDTKPSNITWGNGGQQITTPSIIIWRTIVIAVTGNPINSVNNIIWGNGGDTKPANITWGNGGSSQQIDTISNIIWGNGGDTKP
ncbi:MAG: hypothetical protein QM758_29560 [Armatimonas sp.]